MGRKKDIKQKSKLEHQFKKTAIISEVRSLTGSVFSSLFNVEMIGDIRSWYKKLELIAHENSTWTESLIGKPLVTVEYFDADIKITLDYISYKKILKMPLYVLGDICIAAEAMNILSGNKIFSEKKIEIVASDKGEL